MDPSGIRMAAAEGPAFYDNPLEGVVYMERSLD